MPGILPATWIRERFHLEISERLAQSFGLSAWAGTIWEQAKDEKTAVEIIHRAVAGGITFFDCCWEYNRGQSEDWFGKGLKGSREKVFLMSKVCTHGRDAAWRC